MQVYVLIFNRVVSDNILHNMFPYTVIATNKRQAVQNFLKVDTTGSPLCTNFGYGDFKDKYPQLYNDPQCQKLIELMEENEVNDWDIEESEEDTIIYHDFIINNLDLITDVLLMIDEDNTSDYFSIKESRLISY